jgi:cardiolipin synthase
MRGAAGRGVKVSLIVPERVDSFLTRYASRSYYDELLDMGVEIHLYRKGLLHTKSISVDGAMSMFGTVNLDLRSLWLNYEVALFVYEPDTRSFHERFLENALRLTSPLL